MPTKISNVKRDNLPNRKDAFVSREATGDRVGMRRKVSSAPKTLDQTSRTIQATITTDTPVRIYDWSSDEYVDEILTPRGMQESEQGVQLRDNHRSWSTDAVVGSVGNFQISDRSVEATLEFSSADDVQPLFVRVSEGHLRGVSIGGSYSSKDYTQVQPGKSMMIEGRKYTATDVPLRVVTRWTIDEVSIVVRGADRNALTRGKSASKTKIRTKRETEANSNVAFRSPQNRDQRGDLKDIKMKWSVRALAFLRKQGLDAKATPSAIVSFARGLNESQRTKLVQLQPEVEDVLRSEEDPSDDDDDDSEVDPKPSKTKRSEPKKPKNAQRSVVEDDLDTEEEFNDHETAILAERRRIAAIRREASDDIPAELVNRAIDQGWTVDQACRRFYQHIQRQSRPPIDNGDRRERAPAGHVASGPSVESLQAAVLMRHGYNLENPHFATEQAQTVFERSSLGWLFQFNRDIQGGGNSERERILEVGRRYRNDNALRTCERILSIRGKGSVPTHPDLIIERSFGTSYLPRVFGAIISVGMIQGFMSYQDSTLGWTSEADWNDFRDNQPIGIDSNSSLKLHVRGTTAKDVEFSDFGEKYKVNRFCGKFTLDDQDIIDDVVGSNQQMPSQMGILAASLRPDLVYAVLMANAALTDTVALFHSSRGNVVTTNALSIAGLTAAEAAMAVQKVTDKSGNSKALNMRAGWLVVPRSLRGTGKSITTSTNVVSGSTTPIAERNPHDGEYMMRSDARLDVGVVDPRTNLFVAGSATKWFIAEQTGQQTLQVGFRRGTGRAPQVRTMRLSQPGQWGLGWDVVHDIGVGVVTPRGMVQSTP